MGATTTGQSDRGAAAASRRRRERRATALLLAPPLVLLAGLFLLPVGLMVGYSFWRLNDAFQVEAAWSLEQYARIFNDPFYLSILFRSAWLALLTTVASLLIAFPLAYYLVRMTTPRVRIFLLLALIVPGWVSVLIRTYAWNMVIGESGLLNYVLLSFSLVDSPVQILFTETAVVIGLIYIYLPYMLVPVYASLERLDSSLLEAAENLGAGPVARLWRIILPLTLPGIAAGSIITFIPALGEYLVPNLLGGLRGQMYANLITQAFSDFNWPLGAALGVVLGISVLSLLLILGRVHSIERMLASGD